MPRFEDMFHVYTKNSPESGWTLRFQSIHKEHLEGKARDWMGLGCITDYKITTHNDRIM